MKVFVSSYVFACIVAWSWYLQVAPGSYLPHVFMSMSVCAYVLVPCNVPYSYLHHKGMVMDFVVSCYVCYYDLLLLLFNLFGL